MVGHTPLLESDILNLPEGNRQRSLQPPFVSVINVSYSVQKPGPNAIRPKALPYRRRDPLLNPSQSNWF